MRTPLLSIIMSAKNAEVYVRQSVQSILCQSFKDFEFIIVDDCSSDSTPALLCEFAKSDSRIRLLRNKTILGLTKSLNKALEMARGKYVARQDADDYSHPLRLGLELEFLQNHSNVCLVGTSANIIDAHGDFLCQHHCPVGSSAIRSHLFITNCLLHGSVMFRKSVVDSVGRYRELFRYAQDHDLYLRLSEAHAMDSIDLPLYFWRLSAGGVTVEKQAIQQAFTKLAIIFAKQRLYGRKDSYSEEFIIKNLHLLSKTIPVEPYELKRVFLKMRGGHSQLNWRDFLVLSSHPVLSTRFLYTGLHKYF